MNKKLIVFGLDGATFDIILPLVKEGKLPNIERLIKNGVYGTLESSIPPVTFPAWKCYSTGKKPSTLGVYHFFKVSIKNKRIYATSQKDFKVKEIWDYLGSKNYKVLISEMPTTYPPKRVNGIMISGFPVIGKNYTYPEDLRRLLEKDIGYTPNTPEPDSSNIDQIIQDRLNRIEQSFKLTKYLIEKYNYTFDFIHTTIFYIDSIQHLTYNYFFDKSSLGHYLEKAWKVIDNNIGELMKMLGNEFNVILMSDHGFQNFYKRFNLNAWLIRKGYLKVNLGKFSTLALKFGITAGNIAPILKKLRLLDFIRKLIPREIRGRLPQADGGFIAGFLGDKIDWDKTKAFSIGDNLIYINKYNMSIHEYETLREKIIAELYKIRDPDTGKGVFRKILKAEEVYGNNPFNDDSSPDIVIIPEKGYLIFDSIKDKIWENASETRWRGIHDLYGIFIAYGEDIKKGYEIEGAKIYDLAPTILHMFGLPIPKDMDGRVLMEIFEPDSEPARRQPVYVDPSYYERLDERKALKSAIKNLKLKGKI